MRGDRYMQSQGSFSMCAWLLVCLLSFAPTISWGQVFPEVKNVGLPEKTTIAKIGNEIFVNGVPTEMIGIAVPDSVKNTAAFFLAKWTADGWKTNLQRNGDLIIVSAVNEKYQKVATLTKTGENKTEGSISLTDLPARLVAGKGGDFESGKHLPKPPQTMVLNEVLIRDDLGESITTTLANFYDVEQNTAFYRERMFELGWKERKFKRLPDGKGSILIFERPGKEATFTVLLQKRQTFVTVNWVSK
jgi:hypothetical protein